MDVRTDETVHDVRQRIGTIVGSRGPIPVAIWSPLEGDATHVVLAGHGGSGSKTESYIVSLALGLVRRHQCCVVAIDGPVHGERAPAANDESGRTRLEFAKVWSSDPGLTDGMVTDWRETLDAVYDAKVVPDIATAGYWGLSMGTIFGLPFVAAESRVRACVLGLMGVTGPTRDRLAADAARVTVPTMFLLQWDDELIKRDEGLALFDRVGTTDKTLIVTPGRHIQVTRENYRRSTQFLADRLGVTPDA